jgi:protein TonB
MRVRQIDITAFGVSVLFNSSLLFMMAVMSMQPAPVALQLEPVPISLMQLPPDEEEKVVEEVKEPPPPPPEETPELEEDKPREKKTEPPKEYKPPPPKRPKAVPLHKLTTMPGFARKVEPVYPESLRSAGIEGKVLVEVVVTAQGAIMEIRILKSDNDEFSQAVINAIESSSFITGRVDGKPVPVKVQIPFSFKLN